MAREERPACFPSPLKAGPGEGRLGEGDPRPLPVSALPAWAQALQGEPRALSPVAVFSALPAQSSWPQPSPPGVPHTPGQ